MPTCFKDVNCLGSHSMCTQNGRCFSESPVFRKELFASDPGLEPLFDGPSRSFPLFG